MTYEPTPPRIVRPPEQIADETWLIRSVQEALGAPLRVYLNSMVIRGAEPVIVDTGTAANRAQWLEDVFGLVDPTDVRYVFLSHDDVDHTGNLAQVMEHCPNATLLASWALVERFANAFRFPLHRCRWVDDGSYLDLGDRRLHVVRPPLWDSPTTRGVFDASTDVYWAVDAFANAFRFPLHRCRWVDDGSHLDLGDRRLHVVRPPLWDSPTTRGVFDASTDVYWAVDAFATPVSTAVEASVDDLDPEAWRGGMAMFAHHALSPWLGMVDDGRYRHHVEQVRALGATTVASAHSPLIAGASVDTAFDLLVDLPHVEVPPAPDQSVLDAVIAQLPAA